VIRYDQRGTGASDWMPAWRRAHPYALVDMAADDDARLALADAVPFIKFFPLGKV